MASRQLIYVSLSCLAAASICVFIYAYLLSLFYLALVCIIANLVFTEARVIVGGRLARRTKLFWVHVTCASVFLVILITLAFVAHPLWLWVLGAIVFLPMFFGGAQLWRQGLKKVLVPPHGTAGHQVR